MNAGKSKSSDWNFILSQLRGYSFTRLVQIFWLFPFSIVEPPGSNLPTWTYKLPTWFKSSDLDPSKQRQTYFTPNTRNGSINIFRTKSKLSSTANPNSRKGSSNNHTKGYRIKARIAIGQQITKRIHQRIKVSMMVGFGILFQRLFQVFKRA